MECGCKVSHGINHSHEIEFCPAHGGDQDEINQLREALTVCRQARAPLSELICLRTEERDAALAKLEDLERRDTEIERLRGELAKAEARIAELEKVVNAAEVLTTQVFGFSDEVTHDAIRKLYSALAALKIESVEKT